MNSAADDIATILEDEAVATRATDLFVGQEPDGPDNCLTIYDAGGGSILDALDPDAEAEIAEVQVRARNNSYAAAVAALEAVKSAVNLKQWVEVGTTTYEGIWRSTSIIQLESDAKGRTVLVQTYRTLRYNTP